MSPVYSKLHPISLDNVIQPKPGERQCS
jgi:hypothetical protein